MCIVCGGEFGKEIFFDCRYWGAGNYGRVRNPFSKTQCKGGFFAQKEVTTLHSRSQMGQQNCVEEIMESENHSKLGTTCEEWRSQRRTSTNRRKKRWRWSPWWFLVDRRKLHLSSPRRASSSAVRAEGRNIPNPAAVHWRGQDNTCDPGRVAKKAEEWLLENCCESKFIGVMDRWRFQLMCCGVKAQRVPARSAWVCWKTCVRQSVYLHHPLRPEVRDQTTLSVSRSCGAVSSTWACVCGSSDLKTWKTSFFRYHIFDDALDIVQTCHWLRGSLWLFGNTAYLSTKMFSMPFFSFWQMGMLGGGHSVCSTCCCLLHVVHAFTNFTFCSSWVSFWSARNTFPFVYFFFGDIFRPKMYSVSSVFKISTKHRVCHCSWRWSRALWYNWKPSMRPIVFPIGFPILKTHTS